MIGGGDQTRRDRVVRRSSRRCGSAPFDPMRPWPFAHLPIAHHGPTALRPGEPRRACVAILAQVRGPRARRAGASRWSRPMPTATASPACCRRSPTPMASRLLELDAAPSRCARAHYTRRILLLEGFFEEAELPGNRGQAARRGRAPRGPGANARHGTADASARSVSQGQHRHEPPRRVAPRSRGASSSG